MKGGGKTMAIRIIKPGKEPEPIHFECKHCGCIFEVDATDYGSHMGGPFSPDYAAFCPTCHKLCFSKGNKQ